MPNCSNATRNSTIVTGVGDPHYEAIREASARRMATKPCHRCGVNPRVVYRTSTQYCARCQRDYHLIRTYGINIDQFEEMFEAQGKCCAICMTTEAGGRGDFHVDHCHGVNSERTKVRGILCNACNRRRLPAFNDNPLLLRRAADYLEGKL